eukprot:100191-Pelagomonas_calceolata.AAC.4
MVDVNGWRMLFKCNKIQHTLGWPIIAAFGQTSSLLSRAGHETSHHQEGSFPATQHANEVCPETRKQNIGTAQVRELLQQYNISKEDADAARAVQGGQAESAGGIKGEGSPSNAAAAGAFDDLDGEELSVEQAEGRKAAILLELITEVGVSACWE